MFIVFDLYSKCISNLYRGIDMDPVNITNWFDVFISVVVLLGLFGILANIVYHYGSEGHH